jgi:hypothetical protein
MTFVPRNATILIHGNNEIGNFLSDLALSKYDIERRWFLSACVKEHFIKTRSISVQRFRR